MKTALTLLFIAIATPVMALTTPDNMSDAVSRPVTGPTPGFSIPKGVGYRDKERTPTRQRRGSWRVSGNWSKPAKWCGWYMRKKLGVQSPLFNRARHWASYGDRASPGPGVIVVWPHHVGLIVGRTSAGSWLVESGNDGHRVRTRPRSLRGAIAFRA